MTYELFKTGIMGKDLFDSLLYFCNETKEKSIITDFLKMSDITSIYKNNRKSRLSLANDRGIFSVVKVRSIIDKLVINDIYETVDNEMSDSNVGARKKRNIRDNLYVLYAMIGDALDTKVDIELTFYDLAACFDSMWWEETANDLWDKGVRDDKFTLISLMNEECDVSVKTPVGQTERFTLNKIEMQGTVLGPLK